MAAPSERGENNRIRVRIEMQPKVVFFNSQRLLITMESFWMLINLSDCNTIRNVKSKILSRLIKMTRKLKIEKLEDQTECRDIYFETLKRCVVLKSCHLSMKNCILPSSEDADIIRDGDLITVHVKCNINTELNVETVGNDSNILSDKVNITESNIQKSVSGEKEKSKKCKNKAENGSCQEENILQSKNCVDPSQEDMVTDAPTSLRTCLSELHGHFDNAACLTDCNVSLKKMSCTAERNGQYFDSDVLTAGLNNAQENCDIDGRRNHSIQQIKVIDNTIPIPLHKEPLECDKGESVAKNTKPIKNFEARSLCAFIKHLEVSNSKPKPEEIKHVDTRSISAVLNLQKHADSGQEKEDESSQEPNIHTPNTDCSKRKRVRKRKKKNKASSTVEDSVQPAKKVYEMSQANIPCPNQHIKFDDSEEDDLNLSMNINKVDGLVPDHELATEENTPIIASLSNKISESVPANTINLETSHIIISSSPTRNSCIQGFSIDPDNKFKKLLEQRKFSRRQMEITQSDSGHIVYNSHRRKKNWDRTADVSRDVLENVSTIVENREVTKASYNGRDEGRNRLGQATCSDIATECPSENSSVNDVNYEKYENLQRCPQAGEIIVYKIIELSSDYCPTVSDFKQAKVISVDSESGLLQLELRKKDVVKKRKLGRFELEDDTLTEDLDNIVTHNISELMEIKLICSNNF